MKIVDEVAELTRELPEKLQEEVRDIAGLLVEKRARKTCKKLRLDWAGALKDLRDKHTSVELQHKILEYWVEAALDGCPSAEAMRREAEAGGAVDRNRSADCGRVVPGTASTPRRQHRYGHGHASGRHGKTRR